MEMKFSLLFSIAALCLCQWSLAYNSTDQPFVNLLSNITDPKQLCEFLDLDNCEEVIANAEPSEVVDETGQKMVVSGSTGSPIALFDACNPRDSTIVLPRHPDPDITIWPSCTRAMRCGGCCTSDVFSCEPTEMRESYIRIFDTRLPYAGAHRFQFIGIRAVKIVEHVQCEAQCKTKMHECHKYQIYEARKCRCVCRPERLKIKYTCNANQIWDDSECDCICPNRNTVKCPEPSYFNTVTCKCTLKTGVTGEIDLDMLFEQLDAGLLLRHNSDNDIDAEKEIDQLAEDIVAGHHEGSDNELTDKGKPEVEQGEKGTAEETVEKPSEDNGKGTGEVTDTEQQNVEENITTTVKTPPTTTKKTTPAPTTKPPTTTAPAPTEDPCASMRCFGSWKPRLLANGKCMCFPPRG